MVMMTPQVLAAAYDMARNGATVEPLPDAKVAAALRYLWHRTAPEQDPPAELDRLRLRTPAGLSPHDEFDYMLERIREAVNAALTILNTATSVEEVESRAAAQRLPDWRCFFAPETVDLLLAAVTERGKHAEKETAAGR